MHEAPTGQVVMAAEGVAQGLVEDRHQIASLMSRKPST